MRFPHFIITALAVWLSGSFSEAAASSFFFQSAGGVAGDTTKTSKPVNIKGQVIDYNTKESLPFCNVFISNTLKGSATNDKGFFLIQDVPQGRIQLVVTFIGYKTYRKTLDLKSGEDIEMTIFLLPEERSLKEVQVKAKNDKKWDRQLKRFKKDFLGQTSNAWKCTIKNPYVLEFDGGNREFTASAKVPLEIENKALGYKITYFLREFSVSEKGKSRFYGDVQFENLLAEDEKEAEKWIKNRQEAYEGSLRHFFKAIVDNKLEEEKFLAYEIHDQAFEEIKYTLNLRIGKSRIPLVNEGIVLHSPNPYNKKLVFKKPVEILYKGDKDFLSPYKDAPYPLTIISPNESSLTIHENGWLYKPLSVELFGTLAGEGVADMLPFEYQPSEISRSDVYTLLKDDEMMNDLKSNYDQLSHQSPNEKVFLHFDKPFYAAGDDIWFNSFLTYYNSNQLVPGLSKIHVDLISPEREIIKSLILPVIDGLAPADFSVPDSMPGGQYLVRAYTSSMASFGEEYLFQKPVNIIQTKKFSEGNTSSPSPEAKEPDVQFFPEGGSLISGIPAVIAFKALAPNGKGIPVEGYVLNDKEEQVVKFKSNHLGMGSFMLTPEKGRQYRTKVLVNGELKDFPFPPALKEGYSLTADNSDPAKIRVKIHSSDPNSKTNFYLIGQSREIIGFKTRGTFRKNLPEIEIPKQGLPEGIFQLTLFDENGVPQCERLVYIHHGHKGPETKISPGKKAYAKREKVDLKILVADGEGIPLEGVASVSVTDASLFKSGSGSGNIATHLLLSSDLKGTIEDPEYYFKDRSQKVIYDLDLLMLTHGWRRFSWKDINRPDFKLPQISGETDKLAITGTVRTGKRPLRLAQLLLISRSAGYMIVKADEKGKFRIPDVQIYDTTSVVINTMTSRGRNINATVHFDPYIPPAVSEVPALTGSPDINRPGMKDFTSKSSMINKLDSMYNFEGMTLLNEVQVEGRNTKELKAENFKLHGEPDVAMDNVSERFAGYVNMLEFVDTRLRTINVTRGPSSVSGSTVPLFLVDGIAVEKDELENIIPSEVERIEIIKAGPTAAIYGARSGNGVVAIYKKTGFERTEKTSGIKYYNLPAYSPAREFYHPKYETTPEEDEFIRPDYRTTLYWNPKIITDVNGQAEISFYNDDDTSKFLVTVQGVSLKGIPFAKTISLGGGKEK